jgi:hypothetical protein
MTTESNSSPVPFPIGKVRIDTNGDVPKK